MNGDISPQNEGVEFMDANNLVGIKTGSQVEVIVQYPHGFNALEGDIPRVIYAFLFKEKADFGKQSLYYDPPSAIYLTNGQCVWRDID